MPLEERTYQDYEELGHYILAAVQSLENTDLRGAHDALKAAADKADAMWADDTRMEQTLTNLRNLHEVELKPRVEEPEHPAPPGPAFTRDRAFLVNQMLWALRGELHAAFVRDARVHQAFVSSLSRTHTDPGHSPLFTDSEKELRGE